MKSYTNHTVEKAHVGYTVENYLKQVLHYSGRKIQKLTRQKGILINNKPVYLQKKVTSGDVLKVLVEEDTSYGALPEEGSVQILYEDDHLLVLNKPPRQLVHPAGQTTGGTLANYLAYLFQQRGVISTLRPVHRLDRDTSGCILFAKDSRSQFILEQQLKERLLTRTYWALVKGQPVPASGTMDAPIGPHPHQANRRVVSEKGEAAVTHYRMLEGFADKALLELTLDTGRTHQIRVHLAHMGCPILGDGMYGVRSSFISRQALHAASVRFYTVNQNQPVTVEAPLPPDFAQAITLCKGI